jgi:hypothetical protein
MRAQHIPLSCPAKAEHPVATGFAINVERCGVLDRPLARAMTLTGACHER